MVNSPGSVPKGLGKRLRAGKLMIAVSSSTFRRVISAVIAIWLWGTGPASAGASGGGVGVIPALQQALNTVCTTVHMTSCPQLLSVTQLIVEISSMKY